MKRTEALQFFGFGKRGAECLLYMLKHKEAFEADIERGTNLRQPEVSVGMRELEKRGIVQVQKVKGKGKGRPRNLYKLKIDKDKFLSELEKTAEKKKKEIDKAFNILKKCIEG
ncbi:MAG: ArsR family transcriptional regulator [Thermoplasmata archaeon]|nr:MAG: ArsR family transcriptional regulator [Thermoplasmata archaeon]